jgi:hypothetical protein
LDRKRKTPERRHVPGRGHQAGEQREDADRGLERGAPADVVRDRAPEQCAQKCADQADGGEQSGLRGPQAEFPRDRRQRGAEQREIGGVEHHAEKGQQEEVAVPARERQPLQAPDQLGGFFCV